MERRKFLLGTGALAAGGATALGSGAFSRVESQRDVTIQVAEDPDAYLGLDYIEGSANSENYVGIDDYGHLAIDIGDNPNGGEGVNSDSFTWFDSMVEVCNQGKEGVGFYIVPPEDDDFPDGVDAEYDGTERVQFYVGEAAGAGNDGISSVMGADNAVQLPLGECIELGLRTYTRDVDATENDQLFGDEIQLIADVAVEGTPTEELPPEEDEEDELNEIPVREFEEDPSEEQFDALEEIELTDPFALRVQADDLAGEESTDYAVTAFYDEFDEAPSDRLAGPTTPLEFDEDGLATVTIGSAGTNADVSTSIAPGGLGTDATLVNNIETPVGTDAVFVGDPDDLADEEGGATGENAVGIQTSGQFTEVDESR